MKSSTLTGKLFYRITFIVLAIMVVIGGLAFISASREIRSVYDAQLKNNADVLWQLVKENFQHAPDTLPDKAMEFSDDFSLKKKEGPTETDLTPNNEAEDYFGNARMFRIWNGDEIVMLSDTAFDRSIPHQRANGFSHVTYKKEQWRLYTQHIAQTNIWIEVGEKHQLRNVLVWNILVDLFLPLLGLIPLIGLVLWFGIRSGLDMTRSLVGQIQSRSPDDLSPLTVDNLPDDLTPVGSAINKLLQKLEQSINAERRFSDHAAHQLRTPLAGTKLLIQMLETADTDAERAHILRDLATSNEQSTQLVNKLLIAARVSHQPLTLHPVPLYPLVAQVTAEMGTLIAQKKLAISLEGDEAAIVNADETMLKLLIGNLLENAIKYTPEKGQVDILITEDVNEECFRVMIRDTGPGIPESEKRLVFERFYRSEIPNIDGAGLGLSIVADIIERLGGSIALVTPANRIGLQVEIGLPKAV